MFNMHPLILVTILLSAISPAWAIDVIERHWQGYDFTVVKVDDLSGLSLKLNNKRNQPYLSFDAIQTEKPKCPIKFGMNAGMFHQDFSTVGLFVEKGEIRQGLNVAKQGGGNFLIQPNGVVYWDQQQAKVVTTDEYQLKNPNPDFATQSGPMLVIDGKINQHFIAHSDSLKIRNAVGAYQGQLWFVITEQPINFYHFARFFRDELKIKHALYLDGGSVPSLYLPKQKRTVQRRFLGPMFVWQEKSICE
jgi:uncharacterized protein YigE (DUF2233 family)